MITEKVLGVCPACNESVKENDDCSWICPCDLSETNPYHQHNDLVDEKRQEALGDYSNCPSRHGMYCDCEDLPLHEACADRDY